MRPSAMSLVRAASVLVAASALGACVGGSDAKGSGKGGAPGAGGAGGGAGGSPGSGSGGSGSAGGAGGATGASTARALAVKLGRPGNFLVGMGNDLANDHNQDGAYTLGVTLDLHDAYLVGLEGQGGWPDWNAGGTFVNILADTAAAHGVVPMFTLYSFAAQGEARTDILQNQDFMKRWWDGARLLFDRLAAFDKPAVVHIEPDYWGFTQQASNGDPTKLPALVTMVPDCADLPNHIGGVGSCIMRLGRKYAPKAALGLHASAWGGTPASVVTFMNGVGAQAGDFVVLDALDRDAGCFEAHVDPNCQRNDGPWYWDEANVTHPNFADHLAFAKTIADGTGKPIVWWQVPFGVPSSTAGGTAGHYRDNRVHYLFAHVGEFISAGFAGASFGVGAGNQTYITTYGGQFKSAVTAYLANPIPLP